MNDPVLYIFAVNPVALLNDVLTGNCPGVMSVDDASFITLAQLLEGKWHTDGAQAVGIYAETFAKIKTDFVRSIEGVNLIHSLVDRFRYIHFTYIQEIDSHVSVDHERLEMSAFIDQHHSAYSEPNTDNVLRIPELSDSAQEEWAPNDHVL